MSEICSCGKIHKSSVKSVIAEKGALNKIPDIVRKYNAKKVFVIADANTYKAAGNCVCNILKDNEIKYTVFIYENTPFAPDEKAVGNVFMHYDTECELIIGVGSGVINDAGKILSKVTGRPYIIAATAPSMDGYASATSSMEMGGLKVSLPSKCPDVIIGDSEILKNAPIEMLRSGLGDMIAKYISICEWRIAHILIGEYYCEKIADMIRKAVKKCTDSAQGLLRRDENAVLAVFEGLVMGGMAMEYAGVSRPASGVEHYISHIWDMRGLAFGTNTALHGIQCAIGTVTAAKIYEQVKSFTPDREKALKYAEEFNLDIWNKELFEFVGNGAQSMIDAEKREGKYDLEKHKKRLDRIIENWDIILKIIDEEVPKSEKIEEILASAGVPASCEEIGIDKKILPMTFKASKDIRDKYVLSRLCWDLGIIDEIKF